LAAQNARLIRIALPRGQREAGSRVSRPERPQEVNVFLRGKAKSDELLDVLGNHCGVGLWDAILVNEDALHPQSQWMWTNEFRRLLGFRNESDFPNVCQSWSDKLHPDDAARTFAAFNEALKKKSGKSAYDVTYRLKMAGGDYRWFRATGGVVHDAAGKAVRACGSLVDINEVTLAAAAAKDRASTVHDLTNRFDHDMSSLTETVAEAATRFESTSKQLADSAAVTSSQTAAVASAADGRSQRCGCGRCCGRTRRLGRGDPPSG